ncbi:hypothetical protein ACN24M_24475 [Streptomyces microflavus]|uniref:hypothetical protein n=1 Tax=Streptomyces microflavus TaxID=1919 RepID=UPI003B21FB14
MAETFGGPHRRPDRSGVGRTQRELGDRASFDHQPAPGVSCAVITIALLGLIGLITAYATTGVIA